MNDQFFLALRVGKNLLLQILIPTFNRVNLLIKHLEIIGNSIAEHDLQEIVSIIILDNNSTDTTYKDIKKVADNFKKIKVKVSLFSNSRNIGVSKSYCKLVNLSNAEYVWIQSDDDKYNKSSVLEITNTIKLNSPDMLLVPTSKEDALNIINVESGGKTSLENLPSKSIKAIDKCLGFFGSVVCKQSIVLD